MPSRVPRRPFRAPLLLALAVAGCDVDLSVDPPSDTTVELTPDRLTLSVGDSAQIRSSVQHADLGGGFTFTTLDPTVATVGQFGMVRALRPGSTLVVGTWSGRMLVADTTEVTVVP